MTDQSGNPWKMTAIGLGIAVTVAVVTGVVVANWSGREAETKVETPAVTARAASATKAAPAARAVTPVAAAQPAAAPSASLPPTQAAIDACNQQATAQARERSNTKEIVVDGAIGAVAGAVVGAAGGAIADGGSGALKGAAIGGVLGAGGGALYGVNENRKNDTQYRNAYASCMRSRGYTG